VALKAVYKTDADKPYVGATVTLYANNRKIGQGRVEKSIPNRVTLDETLDVGFDTGTPVMEGYELPFAFTGKLEEGGDRSELGDQLPSPNHSASSKHLSGQMAICPDALPSLISRF
jgi:hypothetical protein